MMVCVELHTHSGFNFLDGASGPEEPVADTAPAQATMRAVGAMTVCEFDSDVVGSDVGPWCNNTRTTLAAAASVKIDGMTPINLVFHGRMTTHIGWRCNSTRTTLVATVSVNFDGVTQLNFTHRRRSKARIAIVFATGFDINGRRLKGRYQIHGRTRENVEFIVFWGLRRHYEIHGTTSNNGTAIFGTSSPVCTLDDGCGDSNVEWRRSNAAMTFAAIATIATTASVNSDEVAPVNFAPCLLITPHCSTTARAGTAPTQAMMPAVVTMTAWELDSGRVGSDVGSWCSSTRTALATTVSADFGEVTPVNFTHRRRSKARIAIIFATGFDINGCYLKGRYQIHGRTSGNVKFISFWGPRRYYKIYGTTSSNGTSVFATFSSVHALNAGGGGFDIGWRCDSTTATLATTVSADFGEVTPVHLTPDGRTTAHIGWRCDSTTTTLATTVSTDFGEVTPVHLTPHGFTTHRRTTTHIATAFAATPDTTARDPEGNRRRRAVGIGER